METDKQVTHHIALTSWGRETSELSSSHDTASQTFTLTQPNLIRRQSTQTISGNPKHWEWEEVQAWLHSKNLSVMVDVFSEGATQKEGTDGIELLSIDLNKLFDEAGAYKVGTHLNLGSIHEAESSPIIRKFLKELTKLKLKANESSSDFTEREATINDVTEMKRRILLFIEKWDRIIWIDQYLETNADLPTEDVISEELGVSIVMAKVYLNYHQHQEREKRKEVDELILDFNVYNDCVLWWYIMIQILTTTQTKAVWLLFNRVAELTPSNVAFSLLDKYQLDLTRFDAENLEELAQNIVVGSQFAICAALRMSKFFMDIANYDVARAAVFENVSESFIDAAFDYLNLIESDHMATVMLEVKSDIDGLSAIDMASEYTLTKFVTNQRIERITTSIMNDFEFLRPQNRDAAFQIAPLSIELIWSKLFNPAFYFIPLGTYCVEVFLYLLYLALFTYLSVQQFRVYDDMTFQESIFWIFNVGYVVNEIQSLLSAGFGQYFADSQNYFDAVISGVFIAGISIRLYAYLVGPGCTGYLCDPDEQPAGEPCDEHLVGLPCWTTYKLNSSFVILWGIATITLWLRLVNFFILTHSLGPMVQMIFSMMGDIGTFFEIMIVLFLAFAFCLVFILGDVMDEFGTPLLAGITLFRAILGDFEFENLEDVQGEISDAILFFGYGVMLLYLVIGSLVLLNLLIAMMAKTFDTIEENTTAAIIFARFQLALDRDRTVKQMPPPFNVFAVMFLGIFYLFEFLFNLLKRFFCCTCCRKREYVKFDLAVKLMPGFMLDRKLELDEQILWQNCQMYWTIITNKGPTKCRVMKYKPEIGDHLVRFYNDEDKAIKVSLHNSVEKKHLWQLDMFDLHRDGLIDFNQFDNVYVTEEYTHIAHKAIKDAKNNGQKSQYWICAFCKGYVKASKLSIKRLGYMLNISELEMKIVLKVRPDICPNCYRARLERHRWQLAWEIVSLWLYRIVVAPVLYLFFSIIIAFGLLMNPGELMRSLEVLKSKVAFAKSNAQGMIEEVGEMINEEENTNNQEEEQKISKYTTNPMYVMYHYSDTQLISNMNEMVEKDKLFDVAVRDDVWALLADAKNDIDVFLLMLKIKNHVMALSEEDELTAGEFFDGFVDVDGLRKNGGDFLWNEYFQPLALTIFERIQKLRNDWVPLHLFRRYPFDIQLVLDDFTGFFDEKENFEKQLKDTEAADIADALDELQSLNCTNRKQREAILHSVENDKDNVWNDSYDEPIFDKFVRYMAEVQALFQDTRTIKNLLRDVSTAIVERGADCTVFQDQIHFLFEDIRNVTLAIPFFNSMRTEKENGDLKVELWTIRNTLYALYFLNNTVRDHILEENYRLHVVKQQLLDMVYKSFKHDIIDPEGITTIISTADYDLEREITSNESKYDEEVVDYHKPTPSFILAQKSLVGYGLNNVQQILLSPRTMNLEERQLIVAERVELFHTGAITASAIRDEISSIFDKIQSRRTMKITESSIAYYRRHGLTYVRLLQDDETLRYIFEQLSRYATFYPQQMQEECSYDLLRCIVCKSEKFGTKYRIDTETKPLKIQNDNYIQQLYEHLRDIYADTASNKFNSIITEKKKDYMTMEDALSIIMLYELTFRTLNTKTIDSGDMFTCNHDVFCKFVDSEGFNPDAPPTEWTNKTRAASHLFQSVLDDAQKVVTLGQIRQTVDKLMRDIGGMKCGELTRIMNHLHKQYINDNTRCKDMRAKYLKSVGNIDAATQLETQVTLSQRSRRFTPKERGDVFDMIMMDEPEIKKTDSMMNPGLQFKHISRSKWMVFADSISKNFQNDVKSKTISNILAHEQQHRVAAAHDLGSVLDDDESKNSKQIIDSILENTLFDIIKVPKRGIAEDEEDDKYDVDEETKVESKVAARIKKKRGEVFDTMLSFCNARVTLQQLFMFSNIFRDFLSDNTVINTMMMDYNMIVNQSSSLRTLSAEQTMKRERIPLKIDDFRREYFAAQMDQRWDAEIGWLFLGTENKYDLCHKIYPFWSGSIIGDIYSFMESTEQIQGNYELKEAEFAQLKHQLSVNDELATKLFHIIRFKLRSLSWKQIYSYFNFLLLMKYNVQRAILQSKQAEDTTVSEDGIKLLLEIKLNDESKWLFSKTDAYHGSKVTWKQISKYLRKMVKVRDEMRDFFRDNARDRDFEKNKSEIINGIHDNVETGMQQNESLQDKLLKELSAITMRLNKMEHKMDSMHLNMRTSNITQIPSKLSGRAQSDPIAARLNISLTPPVSNKEFLQNAFATVEEEPRAPYKTAFSAIDSMRDEDEMP